MEHVAGRVNERDAVAHVHAAPIALRRTHPHDIAVGGDQITVKRELVRLGDFREHLDQLPHDAGVVAQTLMSGEDDLRHLIGGVDVRVVAVLLGLGPAGGAGVGRQRRRRDRPQGLNVPNLHPHSILPFLDCSIKRRRPSTSKRLATGSRTVRLLRFIVSSAPLRLSQ